MVENRDNVGFFESDSSYKRFIFSFRSVTTVDGSRLRPCQCIGDAQSRCSLVRRSVSQSWSSLVRRPCSLWTCCRKQLLKSRIPRLGFRSFSRSQTVQEWRHSTSTSPTDPTRRSQLDSRYGKRRKTTRSKWRQRPVRAKRTLFGS